jgi:vacuolar-type H+-ATPase subunit F/Vma7
VKAIFLGTDDDALGIALSGTTTITATTRNDVELAIRRITTTVEEPILMFSHHAAELIPDTIRQWSKRGSGPMFVVLPEERPCR